jgi:hypothetical protein
MKRVLLTVAALLIPSILMAAPATVGVYFDGTLTGTTPGAYTPFKASLYIVQSEYYVTGVEYGLTTPNDPGHVQMFIMGYTYPPSHALTIGDAWTGQSLTYWPPLTGYPTGYDLLVTYELMTSVECVDMPDYPIVVGPSPDSGFLRGTYSPNNDFFEIVGLTSYLCPESIATEEESWGAIKSMYR